MGIWLLGGVALALVSSCTATSEPESVAPSPDRSAVSWIEGYPVYEWTSVDEYVVAFRACLKDQGFDTFDPDEPWAGQQYGIDIPPGQDAAFQAADARCLEDLGLNPPPPETEESARALYDQAAAEHACLVEEGMTMPSAPTFERFWDDMRRSGWPAWSPYMDVKANPDYARASAACVQALS